MRWAFKIAYDGSCFSGSQRQPELRTVEGEVLHVLEDAGVIDDAGSARFQVSSRTDRGVSALGNIIAFDASLTGSKLTSLLNAKCNDMWLLGYAKVDEGFNPRHARERSYKYLVSERGLDVKRIREVATVFKGTHDFKNFCRLDHRDTIRVVSKVSVRREREFITIGFSAPSFLWNQVRRMVAATLSVTRGEKDMKDLEDALAGKKRYDLGLVPPEPLVLWDVDCNLEFECLPAHLWRIRKGVEARVFDLDRKSWFLRSIAAESHQ